MRYVFFGTPAFAEIVLAALLKEGLLPIAVVCNPDRPVGRKQIITSPPTKQLVEAWSMERRAKIEVLQPEKLDERFMLQVSSFKPDFFVIAAYAKIVPQPFLDIPSHGAIGVHPSLLPKYRGATPIQSAIVGGEDKTGVTLYLLDKKVDNGDIIARAECAIQEDDTYESLSEKLAELGGKLLTAMLPKFLRGEIAPERQDDAHATSTKKFRTEDGFVAYAELRSAETGTGDPAVIGRLIRALNPDPGVYTLTPSGKRVKLLEGKIENGKLALTKIQPDGKSPLSPPSGFLL